MGYHMHIHEQDFLIKEEAKEGALAAIKRLDPNLGSGYRWDGARKERVESWYSWVSTEEYKKAETLEQAMEAWRWSSYVDDGIDDGDIDNLEFLGEKLGDDRVLFAALAPFVEEGSHVTMMGEDMDVWRWFFTDGKCFTQYALLNFDFEQGGEEVVLNAD